MCKKKLIRRSIQTVMALTLFQVSGIWAEENAPVESMAEKKEISEIKKGEQAQLKQVEAKYVCMVNNTLFPKEQIPVEVKGKTYYGCCKMCKKKLTKSRKLRRAVDPVSGKTVDKATAIIGADHEWKAYYFENEENLKNFKVVSKKIKE